MRQVSSKGAEPDMTSYSGRRRLVRSVLVLAVAAALAGCAQKRTSQTVSVTPGKHPPATSQAPRGSVGVYKIGYPYRISGRWYRPRVDENYNRTGVASWYGDEFANRPTANGETFYPELMTAAHKTLPLPSVVEVTNLDNNRKVRVRVNDRGPFAHERIIDMSRMAARKLGFLKNGTARVRVRYLKDESRQAALQAQQANPNAARRTIWAARKRGAYPGRNQVASATSRSSAAKRGRYFIQAGAFSDRVNAEALRDQIGGAGTARVVEVRIKGQTYYRVRVGPARTEADANRTLTALIDDGHNSAHLVRE